MGDQRQRQCSDQHLGLHVPEVLRVRVAFADTDAMGLVWHGNYLRWFEMARIELLRPTGLPFSTLVERGYNLPVIETLVRHRRPARFDDELIVRAAPRRFGGVRLLIDYRVDGAAGLIVEGHTEHAFTDAAGRVKRPPRDVQEVLARLTAEQGG